MPPSRSEIHVPAQFSSPLSPPSALRKIFSIFSILPKHHDDQRACVRCAYSIFPPAGLNRLHLSLLAPLSPAIACADPAAGHTCHFDLSLPLILIKSFPVRLVTHRPRALLLLELFTFSRHLLIFDTPPPIFYKAGLSFLTITPRSPLFKPPPSLLRTANIHLLSRHTVDSTLLLLLPALPSFKVCWPAQFAVTEQLTDRRVPR